MTAGASRAAGAWQRFRSRPARKHEFWKYNWIIYHKTIRALERARVHARGELLDVGCGSRPFAAVFDGHVSRYVGTDLASSRYLDGVPPDAYSRSEALPFRDAAFDTVLGLSMMTYLPEPLAMLREANRVTKPGGTLLLEFTQMVPLHDPPWDFFRFTRFGAAHLLERAGYEPLEFIPIGGLWTRVGMSAIAGLNRVNRGPTRVLTEIPVRLLYCGIQLACELLDRLWFDPNEVVAHLVVSRKQREVAAADTVFPPANARGAVPEGSPRPASGPAGAGDASRATAG